MRCQFSLYYPHKKLPELMKHLLIPVVEVIKNEWRSDYWNYFLSLYKGENVAVSFYMTEKLNEKRLYSYINTKTKDFFDRYPAECPRVRFPLEQLFLNVSNNTLYFWDRNPFYERTILTDQDEDRKLKNLLSNICMVYYAEIDHTASENSINLYLTLMMLFTKAITSRFSADNQEFCSCVLNKIKELKKDESQRIQSIEKSVTELINTNHGRIFTNIDSLRNQLDHISVLHNSFFISTLWDIILDVNDKNKIQSINDITNLYLNIFFQIIQKINLNLDELIKAALILKIRFENITSEL